MSTTQSRKIICNNYVNIWIIPRTIKSYSRLICIIYNIITCCVGISTSTKLSINCLCSLICITSIRWSQCICHRCWQITPRRWPLSTITRKSHFCRSNPCQSQSQRCTISSCCSVIDSNCSIYIRIWTINIFPCHSFIHVIIFIIAYPYNTCIISHCCSTWSIN